MAPPCSEFLWKAARNHGPSSCTEIDESVLLKKLEYVKVSLHSFLLKRNVGSTDRCKEETISILYERGRSFPAEQFFLTRGGVKKLLKKYEVNYHFSSKEKYVPWESKSGRISLIIIH